MDDAGERHRKFDVGESVHRTALSLFDGGIAAPIGAIIPFSMIFYAIMLPPRPFAVAAVLSAAGYASVALLGPPAPTGYAVVYAACFGCISRVPPVPSWNSTR